MEVPTYYQCPICKLHFTEENLKRQCEAWCSTHDSCNLQIASQSVEAQKNRTRMNDIEQHEGE